MGKGRKKKMKKEKKRRLIKKVDFLNFSFLASIHRAEISVAIPISFLLHDDKSCTQKNLGFIGFQMPSDQEKY